MHSNVGGGYKPDGLANEALHWIVSKAEALGLEIDHAYLDHFEPHFDSKLHDSMSFKYRLFGPFSRAIGSRRADGECVHDAAIRRMNHAESKYAPGNLSDVIGTGPRVLPVVKTVRTG